MNSENFDGKEMRRRAEDGDGEAQYEIGWRSAIGMGLAEDEVEAVNWLRRAAGSGHMLAQNNLGARYLSGEGVERDPVEAWRWFNAAAEQGDRKAAKNRDSVGKELSSEQLEAARSVALGETRDDQ